MKPLTFWNKIGYGAGALTENNVQNVVNIMLPLIMFNYMGVSPILLGYVFAIARLWDTVTDPLMGYLSDRTRSRFGKRKPYILVGGKVADVVLLVPDRDLPSVLHVDDPVLRSLHQYGL